MMTKEGAYDGCQSRMWIKMFPWTGWDFVSPGSSRSCGLQLFATGVFGMVCWWRGSMTMILFWALRGDVWRISRFLFSEFYLFDVLVA